MDYQPNHAIHEILAKVERERDAERAAREKAEASVAALENFLPTAEQTNALPRGIRQYVHDLETRCDHSGELRELILARDLNKALEIKVEKAEAMLREATTFIVCQYGGDYDECQCQRCKFISRYRAEYEKEDGNG